MALPRGECTTSCSPPRGIRIRNLSNCRVAIHTPPGANKGHDTVNLQYSCGPVGCHLRRKVVEFAVSHETHNPKVGGSNLPPPQRRSSTEMQTTLETETGFAKESRRRRWGRELRRSKTGVRNRPEATSPATLQRMTVCANSA